MKIWLLACYTALAFWACPTDTPSAPKISPEDTASYPADLKPPVAK